MWGSNGGSWIGVLGWCRPCRAKRGMFWVNRLPLDVWGKNLIIGMTDIIGFAVEGCCFMGFGMVGSGFCINMVPINGWVTNNVWHLYGWGRHPHACNNVKIIIWYMLYNTRVDHIQLMIHSGFLTERLNTILICYIGPMAFSWNVISSWLTACWIWNGT